MGTTGSAVLFPALASMLDLSSMSSAGFEIYSAGSAAALVRLLSRERMMIKEVDFIVLEVREVGALVRNVVN